ncbi:hypothetical protein V9T40_009627 [Parthenolecanium corni]|uniref:MAGE domain-containing protein n=1 Tax=Parthenolecanium corni TaxID=536013 RepID=A0AAN9TQ62_9HEMI
MSQVPLNPDEVTRYVQESVLYFLSQHSKNSTIKRLDYAKAILTDTGRRMQNEVIKQTKKVLKLIYGLAVIEIDENVKQYLLVNEIEHNPLVPPNWSESQKNEQALLLPVLAVIFMNGGSIPEGELWTFLLELKIISPSSRVHDKFGDIDRLLKKDLVAQRYLIYEPVRQVVDDDRDKLYEFRWGIRAHSEVSNEKILRHVSEVLGREITDFAEQYAQVSSQQ